MVDPPATELGSSGSSMLLLQESSLQPGAISFYQEKGSSRYDYTDLCFS